MREATAQLWHEVHSERQRLVDDLAGLPSGLWSQPSLCPGWDVHDVLAHVVDTARTGEFSFTRRLLAARMDFDLANAHGVARERHPDPQDTLDTLRQVINFTRRPPARPATRLVEAVVHGEDIRRPLAIAGRYPDAVVVQALEHQLRTATSFGGGRERAAGLELVDITTGASWGRGARVEAAALDLLLAVSGRPLDEGLLQGPGAARLAGTAP